MGPRSAAGFDEIEAGYAQQAAEEEEAHEPAFNDDEDDDETPKKKAEATEEDEFALAEREYLNEMSSGMHITEEDEIAI